MLIQFAAAVLGTYTLGNLLGYAVHWIFHQPWSGKLYKIHLVHHETMYPASDFLSDTYREAGANDTMPWFVALLAVVIGPLLTFIWWMGVPAWVIAVILVESVIIGVANERIHDSIHLKSHWMDKLPGFQRLRVAHRIHHANVKYNLGIFFFGWDRVFGTWKKPHVKTSKLELR